MRLERTLRLSFYLTLALATICLGHAELFFLPWMPLFVAALCGLLVVAYRVEGRWTLSVAAANVVGLVIAAGATAWIISRIPRTDEDLVRGGVPWPAGLLPHVGPVLMLLLLVKLFRP